MSAQLKQWVDIQLKDEQELTIVRKKRALEAFEIMRKKTKSDDNSDKELKDALQVVLSDPEMTALAFKPAEGFFATLWQRIKRAFGFDNSLAASLTPGLIRNVLDNTDNKYTPAGREYLRQRVTAPTLSESILGVGPASLFTNKIKDTYSKNLEVQALEIQLASKGTTVTSSQDLASSQKEVEDLQQQLASFQKSNVDLQRQLASSQKRIEELQQQLGLSQKSSENSQQQLQNIQHELQLAQHENTQLQQQLQQLQKNQPPKNHLKNSVVSTANLETKDGNDNPQGDEEDDDHFQIPKSRMNDVLNQKQSTLTTEENILKKTLLSSQKSFDSTASASANHLEFLQQQQQQQQVDSKNDEISNIQKLG